MICLPIGILTLAVMSYYCSLMSLKHRLATMTDEQKTVKTKEAMHKLFELADADHSGKVEPRELAEILRSLGWPVKLPAAMKVAEKIEADCDEFGHLLLTEKQFVEAITSGKLNKVMDDMNIVKRKRSSFRRRSITVPSPTTSKNTNTSTTNNNDHLVQWILRSGLISNSLSGATQLLLLAHTPVSRKVFQYFHCHNIAGKKLLRADYDIDCTSTEYWRFLPLVLGVLLSYTVALPLVISSYLYRHRNKLYTTETHQRIGWLYDPFVRGAEFWQVHDLLMKMLLTVS